MLSEPVVFFCFYFKKKESPAKSGFCALAEIAREVLGRIKQKRTKSSIKIYLFTPPPSLNSSSRSVIEKNSNSLKIKRIDSKFIQETTPQEKQLPPSYAVLALLLKDC